MHEICNLNRYCRFQSPGLRQRHARRHTSISSSTASICDERRCSTRLLSTEVQPHYSILRQLHWLKAKQRIDFKVAVLVYKCLHGSAPLYLASELCRSADVQGRNRLRSASTSQLVVRQTRRTTLGDRSFLVSGPRLWNTLPQHVTSASSLQIFKSRLKTHLFSSAFP